MPSPTPDTARYFIGATPFDAPPLTPGLYVVATPIGNLRDITLRALETLAAADLVLCEDTRTSARLLEHYGIRTTRKALHEHNERQRLDAVVADLARGSAIALISDAGTPLISDPGFPLVRAAREAGVQVFAVPGASALLAALTVAGLPTDRFSFIGFLPPKAAARLAGIVALAARQDTLVFYESPRRLGDALGALAQGLGEDREAVVVLELTKRFERLSRGTLGSLASEYAAGDTRGEAVILVAGAGEPEPADETAWRGELADALTRHTVRAAVDLVTERHGLKRKEVYDVALAIKNGTTGPR